MSVMVPDWLTMRDTLWLKSVPIWEKWCQYITQSHWDMWPGGHFKHTYKLVNLGACKFSLVKKLHIFQCMGKIFWVEFQRKPLKFHTKYLTHTLNETIYFQCWKFRSSKIYELINVFEMPPPPPRVTSLALGQSYDYPVPVKQPWRIWVNGSYKSTRNSKDNHNKQAQQKCGHISWDILIYWYTGGCWYMWADTLTLTCLCLDRDGGMFQNENISMVKYLSLDIVLWGHNHDILALVLIMTFMGLRMNKQQTIISSTSIQFTK